MSAPLCRAIDPTIRWRVMRTFTPAVQAPVGWSFCAYLELFGADIGTPARSAVGMVLPLNVPVECEAEIEIE
jgi:hypothetical protein